MVLIRDRLKKCFYCPKHMFFDTEFGSTFSIEKRIVGEGTLFTGIVLDVWASDWINCSFSHLT